MTFISVIRVVALWFPPRRNPLFVQLTALIGRLGAPVSAVPPIHRGRRDDPADSRDRRSVLDQADLRFRKRCRPRFLWKCADQGIHSARR